MTLEVSADPITLSRLEFDVLWEHLGLGPFPTVYRLLGHGQTYDERARLVQRTWDSLRERGLGGPVSLDARLVAVLRVLARPAREVDARINHGSRVVRALAGSAGEEAAVAVLDADGFRLTEVTPGGLSRAMVALLPAHPAGTGHSVSLSDRAFSAACQAADGTKDGLRAALLAQGLRPGDAEQLAEALDDIATVGQFGGAQLDSWGRRRRGEYVVGFVDSAAGRYLLESRTVLGGGERWTTVAPTDPVRLAGEIDRLHSELARTLHA